MMMSMFISLFQMLFTVNFTDSVENICEVFRPLKMIKETSFNNFGCTNAK